MGLRVLEMTRKGRGRRLTGDVFCSKGGEISVPLLDLSVLEMEVSRGG